MLEVFYKINHITDKDGNSKNHIDDLERRYIPYVVSKGRSALLIHKDNTNRCLQTSTVEEVSFIHNMLVIKTMNTVYWLEPVIELKGE